MSFISPNFAVKSIFFPNFSQFWPGAFFPKLFEKALQMHFYSLQVHGYWSHVAAFSCCYNVPCYEIPLNVPLLETMTQPVSATVTAHLADMSV